MAVAEMGKLNLAAMSYDKDGILNALQRTGATEIKLHCETQYSVPLQADCEELRSRLSRAENALSVLLIHAEEYCKQAKIKADFSNTEVS